MVVKKPLEKIIPAEIDIDALIDKGAKVQEDANQNITEWTNLNLRIRTSMLKEIDSIVSKRVGITRTGWILETIHERLKNI